MRGLAWVLLFFFMVAASPLSAAFAVVDCTGAPPPGSFPSVAAALATLDEKGPNAITVNGTCMGAVSIQYRDRLTIAGSLGARLQAPSGTVLLVSRSRGFVLRDIAVSGGHRAVWVTTASDATLEGVVLESMKEPKTFYVCGKCGYTTDVKLPFCPACQHKVAPKAVE